MRRSAVVRRWPCSSAGLPAPKSIWVTFRFGFWTITIDMALGIALALMLEKPIRGASVFRTIFILPPMISPMVVGLVLQYLFDGCAMPFESSRSGLDPPSSAERPPDDTARSGAR